MKRSKASHYLSPICNCNENCGGFKCKKASINNMLYAQDEENYFSIPQNNSQKIVTTPYIIPKLETDKINLVDDSHDYQYIHQ
jgi:hypothetical protein